jgi:hypothetical protein
MLLHAALAAIASSAAESTSVWAQDPSMAHAAVLDPSATGYPVERELSDMKLEFHGNSETDVGFAKYTFSSTNNNPEEFFDFRGRFVLGADLDYSLGGDYFFGSRGQFVLWIREQSQQYQVNADDVYIQIGDKKVWDFLIGRFMTWRVYRKGLGYDIYTLEDTGGLVNNLDLSVTANSFGPHIYEVDEIFLRNIQGRAAFHLYPSSWSGIEVVGEYGRSGTANSIGTRAAGRMELGPLSLAAAAEAKHAQPAVDNPGCETCGIINSSGYGGGVVLDLRPLQLGANGAIEHSSIYSQTMGVIDKTASGNRTSFGGYVELDPGRWLMSRSLIIGAGVNQTVTLGQAGDRNLHVQSAAYVAYPLGFDDGIVKLVFSKADLTIRPRNNVEERMNHMYAARLRVAFYF